MIGCDVIQLFQRISNHYTSVVFGHLQSSVVFGYLRQSSVVFENLEIIGNCWKIAKKKLRDILNIVYWHFWGPFFCFWKKNYCYSEFFMVRVKMPKV